MSVKFKYRIRKVGGSYRVTIPPAIIEALELKENDVVEITLVEDGILIKPA